VNGAQLIIGIGRLVIINAVAKGSRR